MGGAGCVSLAAGRPAYDSAAALVSRLAREACRWPRAGPPSQPLRRPPTPPTSAAPGGLPNPAQASAEAVESPSVAANGDGESHGGRDVRGRTSRGGGEWTGGTRRPPRDAQCAASLQRQSPRRRGHNTATIPSPMRCSACKRARPQPPPPQHGRPGGTTTAPAPPQGVACRGKQAEAAAHEACRHAGPAADIPFHIHSKRTGLTAPHNHINYSPCVAGAAAACDCAPHQAAAAGATTASTSPPHHQPRHVWVHLRGDDNEWLWVRPGGSIRPELALGDDGATSRAPPPLANMPTGRWPVLLTPFPCIPCRWHAVHCAGSHPAHHTPWPQR